MTKHTKLLLAVLVVGMLGIGLLAFAQDVSRKVIDEVTLDETVEAGNLEIEEPKLLPNSPFYFLKNWGRGIRYFFTFNPVAKANLKLRFTSEKLLEARKLAEKLDDPEIIKKATENYEQEMEGIKKAADKIKKKATEDPKVGKFLDKFTKHQILHHKILERLEEQVPKQTFERIKKAREKHLQRFGEVMQKLEDKTKIPERLEKNLEELEGSKFKHFKHLEILKKLEEKVPEDAKEAIRKARENTLRRFKDRFKQMSPEAQERFKDYAEKIRGKAENKMEILENLRSELKQKPKIRERLKAAQKRILEKLQR